MNYLVLKNISFSYGDEFKLKIDNLQFKKKEINFIIGDNNSGKSTLLSIISGILPYTGNIFIDDKIFNGSFCA